MPKESERCAVHEAKLETMSKQVTDIHTAFFGNGSPEKGVPVRLDRLEVSQRRRDKAFWVTFTAAVGTVAAWFGLR